MGKRVLITGLATYWGGRIAQNLEADPQVEVIVGLDTSEPVMALERTEFVRTDESFSLLSRIVQATQVDTIIHAAMVVDSTRMNDRRIHENNVIGTINLLAAVARPESKVTSVIVKSSTLVYGAAATDPTWFDEEATRTTEARTRVERSLLEVEGYLRDFAEDNSGIDVTILRFANVLGEGIVTPLSQALSLPLVPQVLGFDPLMQFVEQDDVVRAIRFVVDRRISGVYNVAGDGRLPWSEIMAIAGKRPLYLPPMLTSLASGPLARLRIVDLPPELLDLLRFGRGVDNRRFKDRGFRYQYSTAAAVEHLVERQRVASVLRRARPAYRYEADVEAFFRHSPAVSRPVVDPSDVDPSDVDPSGVDPSGVSPPAATF
jgi:UDP-glucose 4-epimerase